MVNTTHMIGVGRDADPATGTEQGLQFSLFDVPAGSASARVPCVSWRAAGLTSESPRRRRRRSNSGPRATCAPPASPRRASSPCPPNSRRWRSRRSGAPPIRPSGRRARTTSKGYSCVDVALTIPLGNVTHSTSRSSGARTTAMTTTTTGGPTPSGAPPASGGHVTRSLRRGDAVSRSRTTSSRRQCPTGGR